MFYAMNSIFMLVATSLILVGAMVAIANPIQTTHGECSDRGNTHCSLNPGSTILKKGDPIRSCGHPNSLKDNDLDAVVGCDNKP